MNDSSLACPVQDAKTPDKTRSFLSPPARFVGKPKKALHPSARGSLPFSLKKPNPGAESWNVPAEGGFPGGYRTGCELAFAVMKQRRSPEFRDSNKFQLAEIMDSLVARHNQIDKDDHEAVSSLHGQLRGFMGLIAVAVDRYMACDGDCHELLDSTPMSEILSSANDGLGLKVKKYEEWAYGYERQKS